MRLSMLRGEIEGIIHVKKQWPASSLEINITWELHRNLSFLTVLLCAVLCPSNTDRAAITVFMSHFSR